MDEPPYVDSEGAQLQAFLEDARDELEETIVGLDDEQARRRLVPSLTTPLAILKHCIFVERVWFHVSLDGQQRAHLGMPEAAEDSWILDDADTVASLLAEYRRVRAEARELAAPYGMDDQALHNRRGPLTLRWIYAHMLRELNRHSGHADILREQILAADGS